MSASQGLPVPTSSTHSAETQLSNLTPNPYLRHTTSQLPTLLCLQTVQLNTLPSHNPPSYTHEPTAQPLFSSAQYPILNSNSQTPCISYISLPPQSPNPQTPSPKTHRPPSPLSTTSTLGTTFSNSCRSLSVGRKPSLSPALSVK